MLQEFIEKCSDNNQPSTYIYYISIMGYLFRPLILRYYLNSLILFFIIVSVSSMFEVNRLTGYTSISSTVLNFDLLPLGVKNACKVELEIFSRAQRASLMLKLFSSLFSLINHSILQLLKGNLFSTPIIHPHYVNNGVPHVHSSTFSFFLFYINDLQKRSPTPNIL